MDWRLLFRLLTRECGRGSAIRQAEREIFIRCLQCIGSNRGAFSSTKIAGIGIGLAICQSIITAHDGSISGSNHPDGGVQFRFTIPASK